MQWIFSLVLEIVEYISNSLLNVFSMDMAYFEHSVPVTNDIVSILLAVGWALLLGNLVFQAMRSMAAGLGFEGEDPKVLFARTFIFSFLLLVSRQICDIGLGITATVIEMLQVPSSIQIPIPDETIFPIGASWLLVLIVGFVVMWQVVRLFFETGERYVVTAVLAVLSPLAFSMGGSKSTEDIFKGWVRMFASMCLMMIFNVIFLKMLISVLTVMPGGIDVLPWMILVMGIARVARKIDSIIARIGLNPAITGDGLGRGGLPGMMAITVARSIGGTVLKTIGRNGGHPGAAGKGGNHTPPDGSGGSGAGSRFYGRANASGGGNAKRGYTSAATYATSTQQGQAAPVTGTATAQSDAVQAARTQPDAQSTRSTSSNIHSAAQVPAGGTTEQRSRPHPTTGAPGPSDMARMPGVQQSDNRHTSVQPGHRSRSAHLSTIPKSTAVIPGIPARPGTAGTQTTAKTSQTEATHFSSVLPTARQEAPAGRPGGAAPAANRQREVRTSQADVSTRQTSVSTQQATAEGGARGTAPSFPIQSHVQSGKAAVPSGTAGISADRRAERPPSGRQVFSGAGSTKAASSTGVSDPVARPAQENGPRSGTGVSHRAPGPSPGMAGTVHADKKAERPTGCGQASAPPAAGRSPAKSMTKGAAPGGVLPTHQKNRPPRQKRGDEDHGT